MTDILDRAIDAFASATEGSGELDITFHKIVAKQNPENVYEYRVDHEGLAEMRYQHPSWAPNWSSFYHIPAYSQNLHHAKEAVPGNIISWSIGDSPGGATAWLFDGEREISVCRKDGHVELAVCEAILKSLQSTQTAAE